ncbi:MAG: alkaline phosphatase D family protein [Spartobacteria bacterium]
MRQSFQRFCLLGLGLAMPFSLAFSQALTHGPVVGGVTAASANVFVRTDRATNVALRYGTDPNLATYLGTASVATEEMSDFTKIIPLTGLAAETTYYLNVVVNGTPHLSAPPFPSFKSFAAAGDSRDFKFAVLTDFTSVDQLAKTTATFASASAVLPDFVFIGGDFDHRGPHRLEEKRNMFKQLYNRTTPFMSDFVPLILERSAIVHQWDDHDAGPNNVDRTYADWPLSQQAFQEYMSTYPLPSVSPGIWQKFNYAQAEFYALDCRSQRDPGSDPGGADKSMLDGNNLGATGQFQWLENGLLTSTARWKVIFTSVVTNPTTKLVDGWGGYQREWNDLRAFITANDIKGVVFISGDLHLGAIDNGSAAGFPEMCVASANSQKKNQHCATSDQGTWSEGTFDDPCTGYGLVTILTEPDRLILEAVDETGATRVSYTVNADPLTPPTIVMQAKDQRVRAGASARFRVSATGSTPLSYQWQKNGMNIPGASEASYITPPTTAEDNAATFAVIVSNPAGSITSNSARLRVKAALTP